MPLRRLLSIVCAILLGFALPAWGDSSPKTWPKVLVLGTYPSELPSEELEKIEPIRTALERRLAAAGYPSAIDIQIFQSYDEAVQGIADGKVDFARMGPANFVLAKARKPQLKLLGMETQNGSRTLTGYIFVHQQSPVKSLKELKGRTIAFGSPSSTTGRYFPQAALLDAGIRAADLLAFRYLGRHDKVYRAVGPAGFDAGCANEVTFKKYGMEKNFRIVHVMKSPAHAWVARADLPDNVYDMVRKAMLALQPEDMALLSRDGIVSASDEDYAGVRRAMKAAEGFGG